MESLSTSERFFILYICLLAFFAVMVAILDRGKIQWLLRLLQKRKD